MDELPIRSGDDVVRVRQHVRNAAADNGLSLVDQTKLVTAASELARNTLVHGGGGVARVEVVKSANGRGGRQALFHRRGTWHHRHRAGADRRLDLPGTGLGLGLSGTRRLVDEFELTSKPGCRDQRRGRQVVTVNRSLTAQAPGDLRWLRVEDPSAAAACRGAAVALAARLGFPAPARDELALAVTEAASNLHKHARQGSMLLRITRDGDTPGIELVTIDAGPGFARHRRRAARRPLHQRHPGHRARRDQPAGRLLRPVLGAWPWHGAGGQVLARAGARARSATPGLVRPIDRRDRVRRRLRRGGDRKAGGDRRAV